MPAPDHSKPIPHVSISIDAIFGSEIQRDVSMKVLSQFLQAWTANVNAAHQKNKVTVKVREEQSPEIVQ